jgi:hypothetical protein
MNDEKEARLEKAYEAVAAMDAEVTELLKSEEAGLSLTPDGKSTVRDAIVAYRRLLSQLADVLCGKIDEQAEALTKAKIEGTITEKVMAAAEETPEGALIVSGKAPSELTVMVFRKMTKTLLMQVVKLTGRCLAGGDDSVLETAERTFAAKKTDFQTFGYEGAPCLGSAIVQKVEAGKVRKAARGPEEPEHPLRAVGEYLLAAATKKANRSVNLT